MTVGDRIWSFTPTTIVVGTTPIQLATKSRKVKGLSIWAVMANDWRLAIGTRQVTFGADGIARNAIKELSPGQGIMLRIAGPEAETRNEWIDVADYWAVHDVAGTSLQLLVTTWGRK